MSIRNSAGVIARMPKLFHTREVAHVVGDDEPRPSFHRELECHIVALVGAERFSE
jgi:hypothetical protein